MHSASVGGADFSQRQKDLYYYLARDNLTCANRYSETGTLTAAERERMACILNIKENEGMIL